MALSHTYATAGKYTVMVTVKDKGGASVVLTATVNASSAMAAGRRM